ADRARRAGGRRRPRLVAGAQRGAVRAAPALSGLRRLHRLRHRAGRRQPRRGRGAVSAAALTGSVVEVEHPLVQHKLGLLRDEQTTTQMFRQLVNELTLLLTYEATKSMQTETVRIRTPNEETDAERISGKKVAVCPILRAGVGMLDGVLSLISGARVGFIGLYRDEETLQPVEYYVKLPQDVA